MSNRSFGALPLVMLLAGVASGVTAASGAASQDASAYQLASAQVVMSAQAPPILKLTANGPIAFASLPADEAGVQASPERVIARLYGVTPGAAGILTSLAPFNVTVRAVENDSIVTIEVAGLPAGHALELRASDRTNEVEARVAAAPVVPFSAAMARE